MIARRLALALTVPLWLVALACGFLGDEGDTPPAVAPPAAPPVPAPAMPAAEPPTTPAPSPSAGSAAAGPRTCVEPSAATTLMSPVEHYAVMADCARAGRIDDAVFFFALGGVYGRFDTMRVAYRSGHGAPNIIRSGQVQQIPAPQWEAVDQRRRGIFADPAQHRAICVQVRGVGHPTYHPQYMISHGSFLLSPNTEPPLVADFDPAVAWEASLNGFLHCDDVAG